jgi:hypothetical protein
MHSLTEFSPVCLKIAEYGAGISNPAPGGDALLPNRFWFNPPKSKGSQLMVQGGLNPAL